MPVLSRTQVATYAALVFVVVLVGARVLRADGSSGTNAGGAVAAAGSGFRSGSGTGARVAPAATQGGPSRSGAVEVEQAPASASLVHVAGAVRHPGVYRLEGGARVEDAIRKAGGARGRADLDQVNLAAKVADGQQILVPLRAAGGVAAGASAAPGAAAPPDASGGTPGVPSGPSISLNAATAEQLDTLEGVGAATAAKILAYRTEHGGFRSVDELAQIPGIGPKRLAAIRPRVHV